MAASKKIHDAFPTKRAAKRSANDLNLSYGVGPADRSCPRGPGAVVRKLKKPQDGGRLKFGVYVNRSCKSL